MGSFFSSNSKNHKNPKNVFERGKQQAQKRLEEIEKNSDPKNKRTGRLLPSSMVMGSSAQGPSTSTPSPTHVRSYDDMALDDMRYQLNNDANAFLLNNILLSVQFFENYEREMQHLKDKPISDEENLIYDAMIRYNKHVFFADRLLEQVSEHVSYQKSQGQMEALASSRMYVIYDNLEAKEPGDTSNYSAAINAPFYKLQIEDCKKQEGYVKLKKIEVLESTLHKERSINDTKETSDYGIYTDSGKEFSNADNNFFATEVFSSKTKTSNDGFEGNDKTNDVNSSNLDNIQSNTMQVINEKKLKNQYLNLVDNIDQEEAKPKKSILKNTRYLSAATPATRYIKAKDRWLHRQNNNLGDESEYDSSGYSSILSGGSSITDTAIPKKIEQHTTNYASSSGVLPNECWTAAVKKVDNWSDDEDENIIDISSKHVKVDNNWTDEDDDEMIDSVYKSSRKLHEQCYYLNSLRFMNNFIVNFKQDLGSGLGFSQDSIRNAMTHGASIYCDSFKDFLKAGYEIIPGLTTTWLNDANQWIIRERKIVHNPRNNYEYQWPVKYMVSKAADFGCLLVPLGYRPKEGSNPEQKLQWKITFPAAERYLESFLAHSHIRCYLFTLVLHKTFMENDNMMIGIDASHIKNHLFWQCEDNFAKWPEDRLGQSLRLFLGSFYTHFAKSRLPNYFMERFNEFEGIPASVLSRLQYKLKDIQEALVMHMLYAIDKLKYNSVGFYPTFDCQRLYDILTCKNPLRLTNPNLSAAANNYEESTGKPRKKIKTNIILPARLETERRHLVLKFFIPHFIAMARSSEKFDAINQAMIYLEQARRLCLLLLDEPGGDTTADEYLEIIRDKLADCQRKKVNQDGFNLPPRKENTDRSVPSPIKQRSKKERVKNEKYIKEDHGIPALTIADIHVEQLNDSITEDCEISLSTSADMHKQQQEESITEDHGIIPILFADIHIDKQQNIQLIDNVIEESYL